MKNLKKALGKEDTKKYQNKNITVSYKKANQTVQPNPFSKNKKWTDIDDLIECRNTLKKNVQLSIEKHFSMMLEDWLQNDQTPQQKIESLNKTDFLKFDIKERTKIKEKDIVLLLNKLIDKYIEICWDNQKQKAPQSAQKRLEAVKSILERMNEEIGHGNQQNKIIEKCISVCLKQSQILIKDARRKQKQKSLKEYDQLIKILKPTSSGISPRKGQKIQEPHLPIIQQRSIQTLKNSLSGKNLKIKFTVEQYEFKESQKKSEQRDQANLEMLKKQKSEGNIFSLLKKDENLKKEKIDPGNEQPKTTEEYKAKLYSLLQQPISLKVVKKKVQYECDYSAILDASRTNIKQRNRTMNYQQKQKQYKVKVHNKGKKNDAFIFYRPSQK